jgi:hypothetical protein
MSITHSRLGNVYYVLQHGKYVPRKILDQREGRQEKIKKDQRKKPKNLPPPTATR